MDFGPKVQQSLLIINKWPTAEVYINGGTSAVFIIFRDMRQGCLLSSLMFTLPIEPLAEALCTANDFMGIPIGHKHFKLSLFADHMVLYVSNPLTPLPAIEVEVTGLHINRRQISYIYYLFEHTNNKTD